ncbi:hypothetical protein C9374_005832 [Naegleria lovaniensis]|uniref:Ras family small GTPase n=1 Tax=Naegleria lovaniensis TaxID=51637 RepID=A0AA88KJY0_NAELO|nr:uncharacterized protein C9374_005832 [Naegleria lovaniensis]KAG2382040.1 hypothetical protein C9374_005832 [Naegleria lovaniensis]
MSQKLTIGIFGPFAVGKTSISVQFVENKFSEVHDPTIEDYFETTRNVKGIVSNITILDTAGQETYQSLLSDAMSEAEGFILVYSITDRSSFEKVQKLREKVQMVQSSTVPVILVGNKCDLEHERVVSKSEGEEIAKSVGCPFIETSAKTGLNIEQVFELIVLMVRKSKGLALGNGITPNEVPSMGVPSSSAQSLLTATGGSDSNLSSSVTTTTTPSSPKVNKRKNSKETPSASSPAKKKECHVM